MEKKILPPRAEVPIHETWNLENVFPDNQAWEHAKEEVLQDIPGLAEYKGKLSQGPQTLGDFFEHYEKTMRLALRVMIYGMLSSSVDSTDQQALAFAGQGQSVFVRLNAATSFINPELMAIGFGKLRTWMEQDQRLTHLGHMIDELEREQDHVRSGEVEQILALAGEPLGDFFRSYNALTNADLKFADAVGKEGSTIEVGQSSIDSLITHEDRKFRQTGYENYADGYLGLRIHSQPSSWVASIAIFSTHARVTTPHHWKHHWVQIISRLKYSMP
jgi:oligoendopeptidase F